MPRPQILFLVLCTAALGCGGAQEPHPRPLPPPEVLQQDTRVDGYLFAGGSELQRDEEGRVVRGTIAENRTIAGVDLPPGTVLWFDRGDVLQAKPPTEVRVGDVVAEADAPVRFPRPGLWDTYELCLARAHRGDGGRYPAGSFVEVKWTPGSGTARVLGRSEVDRLMDEVGLKAGCH